MCDATDPLPCMENILVLFLVTMFNVLEVKIEKSDAQKGHSVSRSIT